MTWALESIKKYPSKSPKGYNVVYHKVYKWFGIVVPEELWTPRQKSWMRTAGEWETAVIGFLVDHLGRVFLKATDIGNCYGFVEDGRADDFYDYSYAGGDSFCTLTAVFASFAQDFFMPRGSNEFDSEQIEHTKKLLRWLWEFDIVLDRKLFPRHQMWRVAMTKDGENAYHLVEDPMKPSLLNERYRMKDDIRGCTSTRWRKLVEKANEGEKQ
jgi:hypothetical protein